MTCGKFGEVRYDNRGVRRCTYCWARQPATSAIMPGSAPKRSKEKAVAEAPTPAEIAKTDDGLKDALERIRAAEAAAEAAPTVDESAAVEMPANDDGAEAAAEAPKKKGKGK
jgi:hypothetical protein